MGLETSTYPLFSTASRWVTIRESVLTTEVSWGLRINTQMGRLWGEPWPTVPDLRWGNFSCNWIEVCFHWWRSFPALTSHNSINRCRTFTNKMTQITLSYNHENILPSAKNLWPMIFNTILLSKHGCKSKTREAMVIFSNIWWKPHAQTINWFTW